MRKVLASFTAVASLATMAFASVPTAAAINIYFCIPPQLAAAAAAVAKTPASLPDNPHNPVAQCILTP